MPQAFSEAGPGWEGAAKSPRRAGDDKTHSTKTLADYATVRIHDFYPQDRESYQPRKEIFYVIHC